MIERNFVVIMNDVGRDVGFLQKGSKKGKGIKSRLGSSVSWQGAA
jgi:hypothetical protein